MKIRKLLAVGCAISLLALTSCKSGQEKKGDEFLGKGMYKNAMKAYLQVDKSGKGSDVFNDNYALAMTRLMMQVAQKDGVQSDVIFDYTQEIPKRLEGSTNAAVVQEVVQSFCDIAKMMWELDSYRGRLEAFRLLDNSAKLAKAANAGADIAKKTREEISAAWVKKAVADYGSPSADDAVAAEYYLLEVQNLVPDNAELEAALLKVRRINRHNLLIWSPGVNALKITQSAVFVKAETSCAVASQPSSVTVDEPCGASVASSGRSSPSAVPNVNVWPPDRVSVVPPATPSAKRTASDAVTEAAPSRTSRLGTVPVPTASVAPS